MIERIRHFFSNIDMKKTLCLIALFNIFDAFLTLFWIDLGIAEESNPLMVQALSYGTPAFLFIKITLVSLSCIVIYSLRKNMLAQITAVFSLTCYSILMFYHGFGFYLALI